MLPTQLQIFDKISRVGFPGNQVKNFISWDSEFFTESESPFGIGKISTGKNRLLGIQPSYRNCIAEMTVIWKHYQNDRYYRTKKCYFGLKNIQNQFQSRHFSSKTAQFLFEPATFVRRPLFLLRGSSFSENQRY